MTYLVVGGTGKFGGATVRALKAQGAEDVRVLTRSADKAKALPAGVTGVVGDLSDPTQCRHAFEGVDALFLVSGLAPTELHEGLTALAEAARARVQNIVYLSVHNAEIGPLVPHFASKLAIERALRESGIAHTILRPSSLQQNDLQFQVPITQFGVYPAPIGEVGASCLHVDDAGEVAARALMTGRWPDRTLNIVGAERLGGPDMALVWSRVLGKQVVYGGNDLDAWGKQVSGMLPAWLVHDLQMMYGAVQKSGLVATPEDLAETREVLGHEPRRYEDFVKATAAAWAAG